MTIRSRPSTDTYRENWDRIFSRKRFEDAVLSINPFLHRADFKKAIAEGVIFPTQIVDGAPWPYGRDELKDWPFGAHDDSHPQAD